MSSLVAMVQVSLRRSRAAWPIVASAGLICLLAASLLAAGPMYAGAVAIAGLQRVMTDAPVAEANIEVSMRLDPEAAGAADRVVTPELERALGDVGGTILRSGRSDSFGRRPFPETGPRTELVELGFAEGIEDHATLVAGSWPVPVSVEEAAADTAAIPVAISENIAVPQGLAVGYRVRLPSRIDPGFTATVVVAAIFRIDDPADPFWWDDPQVLDGQVTSERFETYGPFFTTRERFGARAAAAAEGAQFTWRALPSFESLTLEGTPGLRVRVGQLDQRLEASMDGVPVTVTTSLPDIICDGRALAAGEPDRGLAADRAVRRASLRTPSCSAPPSSSSTAGSTRRCSGHAAPARPGSERSPSSKGCC